MTIDAKGNIYITGEAVLVYNPAGELINTIEVPERPSNVCFGGKDKKTLYITARTSFYSIKMDVKGL
jgi:gluconolactonase